MKKATFKEKFRYYFENTMSAGSKGVIKWLGLISLFLILMLGLIILVFGIKGSTDPGADKLGFIEGVWQSLMATLDAGTMGGDRGWPFRVVRFIASLGGIFLISVLIGTISSSIDAKLDQLKKGRSQVLETNHTLILGWSEKVFSIITEIIEANANQQNLNIVILADRDKESMDDEIRSKITDFKTTKVIVRSGNPLSITDITVVNPNDARSIIILSPEPDNADIYVIKTVLALTNRIDRKVGKYHIVAEIKDPKNLEAAELAGNDEVVFVLSSDLISRITAQTCRQPGLSVVYSELLQFEGDEIYFQEEPKLFGKTYKQSLSDYEDSSVIGIFTKDADVLINPPMDTVINSGDSVIAISEDDDTVVFNGKTDVQIDEKLFKSFEYKNYAVERTLILGWNDKGYRIIEELEDYLLEGSEVVIVADEINIDEKIAELQTSLKKQKLRYQKGDINDKKTLLNLRTDTFNHIIILSYLHIGIQESDAKTLICLLHLRNLSKKANKNYSIVSEMLDIRNRELGVVAKADDFIVGDNLTSLMLSQLSENKELKKVYDVLFDADGSEIYLKPVGKYVKTGVPVDFYNVVESAARQNESAIGYKITSKSGNMKDNFGIRVNPAKSAQVTFSDEDFIIVLAED